MSLDNDSNHDVDNLPFADVEIAVDLLNVQKPKYSRRTKRKWKPTIEQQQQQKSTNDNEIQIQKTISYTYFENTKEENNFLTFIPYTGPCNTLHLGRNLFLPQLISSTTDDSSVSSALFIQNYNETLESLTTISDTMSLSINLRFGILYVLPSGSIVDQTITLTDFLINRNRSKEIKTAFYSNKGVTSPKHLITTLIKHNYHPKSLNKYSYDIQLYGLKSSKYSILSFHYDEQFHCHSISYRPDFPINFDFIRNKTKSRFSQIDDSYSDIFDYRIQIVQIKRLLKTDLNVIEILRGVPIDEVLFIDKSTHLLHVSRKLQKFVKYIRCTRSSNYENFDEKISIRIGTYEEFQLNKLGQCESVMKASNTMTIELHDLKLMPSAKKLYDIGMWFSTLCQTCVDLPSTIITENDIKKTSKWFSDVFKKQDDQTIKQLNVNQLTTYKTQNSKQIYTTDESILIKRILQEENLQNIFFHKIQNKDHYSKNIDRIYERLKKRLIQSKAPSADEALQKVERAYRAISKDFIDS